MVLRFRYAPSVRLDFPGLVSRSIQITGINPDADLSTYTTALHAVAVERLEAGPESGFPEIVAWRQAFSKMGLKPTQYRCASEALLRRFRKEGGLPSIHPLVDLCNAVSLAFAIPIAVIDMAHVAGDLEVRKASGGETYLTFGGEVEHPDPDEVIFADAAGQAHARRWTNRQSALSAIRPATENVLIVAEALHGGADHDVPRLMEALRPALAETWPRAAVLDIKAAT